MVDFIMGMEPETESVRRTQVFLATHTGEGKRLPLMNRSFISFTYGGYNIEDFNLIAITDNDRLLRKIYADFNDNTTTSDILDGTTYWSSHFTSNSLSLTLATDEMTEERLNAFKHLFVPGPPKELILAESPNRAIMARIKEPPEYLMLPFEKRLTIKLNNEEKEISTTVYRGAIDILFVMDEPYWYSVYNIFPSFHYNVQNEWVSTFSDPDILKAIYEDGVPTTSMFTNYSKIISGDEKGVHKEKPIAGGLDSHGNTHVGARVGARLATAIISLIANSTAENSKYLFYAGTAPAPTVIDFTLRPILSNSTPQYILYPGNSIYKSHTAETYYSYNSLIVGNEIFKFTTPSLYTGYNLALNIISSLENNFSTIDLRIILSEGIKEYYSRAWALNVLNWIKALGLSCGVNTENQTITDIVTFLTKFYENMFLLLYETTVTIDNTTLIILHPAVFSFDSKTGKATGAFTIPLLQSNVVFDANSNSLADYYDSEHPTMTIVENVGDMVKSSYLFLKDRNYFDANGQIPLENCTKISTDYPGNITDFNISYKHMYL